MKSVQQYRKHASECRALARGARQEERKQLLAMADAWTRLAEHYETSPFRHPELARRAEHQAVERPRSQGK